MLHSAPLQGEVITVNPGDVAAISRMAAPQQRPTQTRTQLPQVQQVQTQQHKRFTTRFVQGAATPEPEGARPIAQRMAMVVWFNGYWAPLLHMLAGFAQHDGRQNRRILLVDTEEMPLPPQIIEAAKEAFAEVYSFRSPFKDANGLTLAKTLIGASGFLYEKIRHGGPAFYTPPIEVIARGSLDQLELEHMEGVRTGRKILGAVVGQRDQRRPYSAFVAHREWIYDPNFPLTRGVGLNTQAQQPMSFMRLEMFRSFRVTNVISPDPTGQLQPDTRLAAFDLAKVDRAAPIESPVELGEPPISPFQAGPIQETLPTSEDIDKMLGVNSPRAPETLIVAGDTPISEPTFREVTQDDILGVITEAKSLEPFVEDPILRMALVQAMHNDPKMLAKISMALKPPAAPKKRSKAPEPAPAEIP